MSSVFKDTEGPGVRDRAGGPAAVLLATAPADDGGPAAGLPWEHTTVAGRLVEQLATLGAGPVTIITRPRFAGALEGIGAELVVSPSLADDFRLVAELARSSAGQLVVAQADLVTQHEALAGLLADGRVATGILAGRAGDGAPFSYPLRAQRGRLTSVASPYHGASAPMGSFLGVVKLAPRELDRVADVADRLAELTSVPLPPSWEEHASRHPSPAPEDATALLLSGLVRSGMLLTHRWLRDLFWTRPFSHAAARDAEIEIRRHDEERARLGSAVKVTDGFFTTFFVSPYSRHIARWAARRGLTPNQVTIASMAVGVAAAASFATGERAGMVAGALLLQMSFTLDCVDGQLARYTRTFTKFGSWLDSIFDRAKEYGVFAGLAIGASRAGDPVWVLAAGALGAQTVRHVITFSYRAARHRPIAAAPQRPLEESDDGFAPAGTDSGGLLRLSSRLDRVPGLLWVKRVIGFPIGERFAAISITAAIWSPRVTFVVLLACGIGATLYALPGQVVRMLGSRGRGDESAGIQLARDDGPLARAVGLRLPLPPIVPVVAGAIPLFVAIAVTGDGAANGTIAAAVAWLVVAAALSSGTPHRDPLCWLVPPLLRLAEYSVLVWIAVNAGRSSAPAAFALLGVLAFRHYDLVYRLRDQGVPPPGWVGALAGGWDGRVIVAWVLLAAGALPAGYFLAAGLLAALLVSESIASWIRFQRRAHPAGAFEDHDDEEDE